MSIEIMSAVWRESVSVGRARLVLLAIADFQGEIGAWPSIATLADMVNASERSVQRDLKELQGMGELIILERQAPSRSIHKANLYWVNLPSVAHYILDSVEVSNDVDEVTNTDYEVTNSVDEVTPVGVLTITKTIKEPLLKLPQNEFEEMFKKFWSVYPRKNDKEDARKAFAKALTRTDFETIYTGAVNLANDPNKPAKAFLKYPASWLNKGGWENEPFPERQLSREEREQLDAARAERNKKSRVEATNDVLREIEEARRRAEENRPEACEHRAVKLLCKICVPQ